MVSVLMTLCRQHILLAWRSGHATLGVSFFFIAATLLPLGLGPELALLRKLAPGLLWVILLMAVLISLERLFQADYEDGTLDQLTLLPVPLELAVLAKMLGHFLVLIVPLLFSIPVAGLLLNIAPQAMPALLVTMLAGTPALAFLGGIGAALALTVKRGAMLTALLVMPLYVPVMIFGTGATARALASGSVDMAELSILLLLSLAGLLLGPVAVAAALRAALR